ncbi:MAG TPA: hypothetical protein VFW89_08160 [Gemmatimonadaceae bacterium]|nr:hypothetical protein [Gemmatimonadaceae bacterium]
MDRDDAWHARVKAWWERCTEDIVRAADLMSIYIDARLGLVDACIMAAAERLEVLGVLTTDRHHYSLVRPRHTNTFRLLP